MRRKLLVAVLAVLVLAVLAPATAQIVIPIPVISKTARGTVGSMNPNWITVVTTDNQILQLFLTPDYKLPQSVQAGRAVACHYKYNSTTNQNYLTRIKLIDNAGGSHNPNPGATTPVQSAPLP